MCDGYEATNAEVIDGLRERRGLVVAAAKVKTVHAIQILNAPALGETRLELLPDTEHVMSWRYIAHATDVSAMQCRGEVCRVAGCQPT